MVPRDRSGLVYALVAYVLWGVSPLYWKPLASVSAWEVFAHRSIGSVVVLGGVVVWTRQVGVVREVLLDWPRLRGLLVSATLLGVNWVVFIYCVNEGALAQASLGYVINPLVSVLLGCFVLRERLRRAQWGAVGVVGVGLSILIAATAERAWIPIVVALSFGLYGLARKRSAVEATVGTAIEAAILCPASLVYLVWLGDRGELWAAGSITSTTLLLLGSGPVTALPLLLFVLAARRLSLTSLGFIQYLSPTLQFALAVGLYREPTSATVLVAFVFVWLGVAIFAVDAAAHVADPAAA